MKHKLDKVSKLILKVGHRIPKLPTCGVLLLFASFLVARDIYHDHQQSSELMTQVFKMENFVSDRQMWDDRASWINRSIPRFDTETGASKFLVDSLAVALHEHGLTYRSHRIESRKPNRTISLKDEEGFRKVSVDFQIKGNEENLVKWIHEIQSPENFRGIDQLTMELGDRGLVCNVKVTQWFLGKNQLFNPGEHQQPEVHDLGTDLVDNRKL